MGDREGAPGGRNVMNTLRLFLASAFVVLMNSCLPAQVRVGADVLLDGRMDIVQTKRVAVVTDHTSRVASGKHLVDVLLQRGVEVQRIFGPEHGIRGNARAGENVADTLDALTGIPVVSLYGKVNKPSSSMLADVDLLLYDIQDVGVRFYTYISTMALCMEAAAERGIPFVVLDRPNPLGGLRVDGPVLEDSPRSFVGIAPIPVVYGLTCGELANLLVGEKMLRGKVAPELVVVPMKGWRRGMHWEDTGLPWIPPSPNIPSPAAAIVYPATCFIEATNLSEGRGTESPFLMIGAPFLDSRSLATALSAVNIPGVKFDSVSFTPTRSKHAGTLCHGVVVSVVDQDRFEPVTTGLHILRALRGLYPGAFVLQRRWFVRLMGSGTVYDRLTGGDEVGAIRDSWTAATANFALQREKYFVYR
jgi:uncharacterized protein YbbC (DUF1343 family)